MNALARRLDALERGANAAPALVWRERGEDAEAALARHLRGRPADIGRDVLFVSWEG